MFYIQFLLNKHYVGVVIIGFVLSSRFEMENGDINLQIDNYESELYTILHNFYIFDPFFVTNCLFSS